MFTSFIQQKKWWLCKMTKKQRYKYFILMILMIAATFISTLFLIYSSKINKSLNTVEGAWLLMIIILMRISILSGMAFYMVRQWFNQEAQYLSDIPFLFGMFFLFLIFGKFLDLLSDLTYYTLVDENEALFILKVRFFIAILTLFPMMYLSIGMILYYLSLKDKYKIYKDEKTRDNTRKIILGIITIIEILAVILIPDVKTVGILLPCLVLPSLITIVWLFAFAYRRKRLSQVHPLILAIGFGIYLISNISRPLAQAFFGETPAYAIFSEIVDLLIFLVIFTGLILKVKYNQE